MIKTIYVTGDIHGHVDIHKLSNKNFRPDKNLKERYSVQGNEDHNDYLIVTGDLGFPFHTVEFDENFNPKEKQYKYWLNWLANKPYTILFCDGNHENFDFWDAQPVYEWHGGKVHIHPNAPNIIHLIRGEVYDICGYSVLAFGGAASHDIKPEFDCFGHCIWKGRVEGKSWWKHEQATEEEKARARETLAKRGNHVDVILTHTPPASIVKARFEEEDRALQEQYASVGAKLGVDISDIIKEHEYTPDPTAEFLDEILASTDYRIWLCGHIHKDYINYENKLAVLYRKVVPFDTLLYETDDLLV